MASGNFRNQLEENQSATSLQPTVSRPCTGAGGGSDQSHDTDIQEPLESSSITGKASLIKMPANAIIMLLDTISDQLDGLLTNTESEQAHPVNIMLRDLGKKKIIYPKDLRKLRKLFEEIVRFDLVHLLDNFLVGNYDPLHHMNSSGVPRNDRQRTSSTQGTFGDSRTASTQGTFSDSSTQTPTTSSTSSNESQRPEQTHLVRPQGDKTEDDTTKSTAPTATNHSDKMSGDMGSNGRKFSKLDAQRSGGSNPQMRSGEVSGDDNDDQPWLCNHYKRRCHVKFTCCNNYWPCHRCHNNESNCSQKKSRGTTFVKCVNCETEQQFTSRSQFCSECHRNLTGTDDASYHCKKCGIRIHEHRYFHCDTCGVCHVVQLRDNHNCREGSAHGQCFICHEDAFTGCQILPCSHRVHKDCLTYLMINGITKCPLCGVSFTHMQETCHSPNAAPH